eukprot:SAG31_NODE_43358_length_267_cov_0.922619_1_plen_46_part_10
MEQLAMSSDQAIERAPFAELMLPRDGMPRATAGSSACMYIQRSSKW